MKYINSIRQSFTNLHSRIQTQRLLNLYNRKKYHKIPNLIPNFIKYSNIQISGYPFTIFLIQQNNHQCLSIFLKNIKYKDQIFRNQKNPLSLPPLFFAYLKNSQQLINLFQQNGAKPYTTTQVGHNLFHLCAIHNKIQSLNRILKLQININAVDIYNNSALHYAAKSGNSQIVKILLKNKAQTNILNSQSKYPIHLSIQSENFQTFQCFINDLNKLTFDVKQTCHPVHIAAQISNIQILKSIIKYNPTLVNLPGPRSLHPLHFAVISNRIYSIQQLLRNKAIIDKQDEFGNTALHLAALQNRKQIAFKLIEEGANIIKKNVDGLTPIDCAFNVNSIEILKYIQTLGRKDITEKYFKTKF